MNRPLRLERPQLLTDMVVERIRAAIVNGEFGLGSQMSEAQLAQQLGVSKTPVREALLRLADEGLVDVKPQRGTFVARLSLKRIEEALFVRQAVECMILERVAAREDRAAIAARLGAIVAEQAAAIDAGDVGTALDADTRFHHAMVVASGLEGVWSVVGEARDLHHRIRAIAVPELGSAAQAIRDHRAIVRAVRDGDAARAARAMERHLDRNFALAKAIAALHPDYFDAPERSTVRPN